MLSNNSKIIALETTLQQSLLDFKELLIDLEQMQINLDICKTQYIELKEKCESKTCCGAEETQKVIQSIRSALTRLSETKNLDILNEIFKILFGESTTLSYPTSTKENPEIKKQLLTPKKELHSSNEDFSIRDESVSEIEGTPTGRHSPIIQTKKLKNSMVTTFDREKKKCPDSWPTPEKKTLKLIYPTPSRSKQNSSLRQARLNFVKTKSSNIIDITCSPEFGGGSRNTKSETDCNVQPLIKKESIENDDTILPSPTSGPTNFTLFKSPMKFKKPQLSLKTKTENIIKKVDPDFEKIIIKTERKCPDSNITRKWMENGMKSNNSATFTQEDSINILHPDRLPNNLIKNSPVERENNETTFCNTQSSISLLEDINELDDIHREDKLPSPAKRPLAENINIMNIPDDDELQPSISVLQRDAKISRLAVDNVKIKIAAPGPDDEGPAPRTRAEKRSLPGWACRECIEFFSELHKDDPDMMLKKINECSHHRGVTNPERPKTPPGYWNPRWNVPDDTEEFNRKNNV
ncbi:unnamed protein product [Arctia plantaginis]|uniref:DNA endonuclease RBBP8 n=1 Tax=Arctia plantaginis TaxID=874455 RepID=A0A8S1BRT3_ARCPL|nr:unnamed protein product [Arctia plantaginis]